MEIDLIIGIVIALMLSAFFSGMEIAFVSSNRLLAEMDKEKNGIAQRCLQVFYHNPNGFVSTMLVGNNIVLVLYGILFAEIFNKTIFASFDPATQVLLDTLCSTVIVIFTGEFIPKTLFKSSPNTLLTFFAPLAYVFFIILWPISRFSTFVSRLLLRIIGVRMSEEKNDGTFTKVDLDYLLQSSIDNAKDEGMLEEEVKIFQNALDFTDTKVRDCMVPRTEINAVDENCSINDLQQKFIESGNSKLIVYKEDIDHIQGYIHSSEMFKNPQEWNAHIRELPFVPETMTAQRLMQIFLQQKKSISVVVDEFGGTSGIVSLEDIVEEIFGDIEDEHDNAKYIAKQLNDNEYLLSARLEIEKVNEMFNLELPESDEYMTISGLILHEYQSFPKLNEIVKTGNFDFKIIKNTMTKIELVRLKVNS
ncbi:hemolysin family protein [Prevotella ihumii]|uniref:hemolysin family protein n=1 Tax=Prevotella ihumii TaxID=1917878 RepID=UPI0009821DB0|nr:hemolysin family protein [Prevotella ihumii]